MSTIDKIVKLINASGFTNAEIAQQLNLNQQVITDWKSGKSQSYKKYLYQLAELLHTTPEYLKGETEQKEKPMKSFENNLSPEELALIKSYRRNTDEIKKAARAVLGTNDEDYELDYKLVAFGGNKIVKKTIKPKLT